jgi:carbamoyltransferase
MKILGISAFYHDSAACLIEDGNIVSAAQEERFSRKKHDANFPFKAIISCLAENHTSLEELDYVVFYEKPLLKFERLIETYLAFAPKGFVSFSKSMPIWLKEKLFQRKLIIECLRELSTEVDWDQKLLFSEHHVSHAASAFYPSPFNRAAVLTMDGVGEWATTTLGLGNESNLSIIKEINFPHSLGLLYSAITQYLGFRVNSGEYKIMGLAPYGTPRFASLIRDNLIDVKQDGSFVLNMSFFNYATGLRMINNKFEKLFQGPTRRPESEITIREMDIAASIQAVLEDVVLKLVTNIADITGEKNLCLAGGVALNCVANGKIENANIFENIWVQPASGDAGGSLGAALSVYHLMLKNKRSLLPNNLDSMKGSFLGPSYKMEEVIALLNKHDAVFKELNDSELFEEVANLMVQGKSIGWMSGRMEFGPRALGNRSIIADARSPFIQKRLNLQIKYRESFRPFAPSVLFNDLSDWFELTKSSPYMLMVTKVKNDKRILVEESHLFGIEKLNLMRSLIPAVTHVDYSARVQTVHEETNPRFYALIDKFKTLSGCPVIVNTSFNIRGEPIVNTPEDALKCFMNTDLDVLVIENAILYKSDQRQISKTNYKDDYELD